MFDIERQEKEYRQLRTRYEKRRIEIGTRIRESRRKSGLTQEQLAANISVILGGDKDIKQSTISNWESGAAIPPMDKLLAMSTIFRCDYSYLLGDHKEQTREISDICQVTGLSEESVDFLMKVNQVVHNKRTQYLKIINGILGDKKYRDGIFYYASAAITVNEGSAMGGMATPTRKSPLSKDGKKHIEDIIGELRTFNEFGYTDYYPVNKKTAISIHRHDAVMIFEELLKKVIGEEIGGQDNG